MLAAVTNLAEYTVTELAFALKRTVEDAYGLVRVRGELSGFKRAASGHLYFTLKDEKACIDAVAWRGSVPKLAFEPADGLEVICTGRLTTYPGRSKYQLVVERIEPAGMGALMALLEERRKALAAEGLFDAARKRPLPFLPEVVGVVTSPTGAVIRDILHRLADRFPRRVIVWPVLVQGEGAAAQVAAAIRGFGALPAGGAVPRPDVLIVARGGGSIEDLWAFNEEVVVRAAAECADPADLGRRPRDRHDADRPRRRPPRADADRRGRDGGAGAARPRAADRRSRRHGWTTPWRGGSTSCGSGSTAWRAACRGPRCCSGWRRSGSTIWASGCGCAARASWCGCSRSDLRRGTRGWPSLCADRLRRVRRRPRRPGRAAGARADRRAGSTSCGRGWSASRRPWPMGSVA